MGPGDCGRGVGTRDGGRGWDRQGGVAGGKDREKQEGVAKQEGVSKQVGVELDPAFLKGNTFYMRNTLFELDPAFLESLREFELSVETMTAA